MGSRWVLTLTIAWITLTLSEPGEAACREAKLPRDCEALKCTKNHLGTDTCELRAAVLLPADSNYVISLPKVLPVLEIAVYDAKSRGLLPPWLHLKFLSEDDRCDATYAQIAAIDSYANCVHLFLGPACDYCVANVGRVAKFLGAPLITTGGFTFDFTENKTVCDHEYFMTTRIGSMSFRDISNVFIAIMDRYSWRKVQLVYDPNGQSWVAGEHTCQLMMKSMVQFLKKRPDMSFGNMDVEALTPEDYAESLKDHVGTSHSSARCLLIHHLEWIYRELFTLFSSPHLHIFVPKQTRPSNCGGLKVTAWRRHSISHVIIVTALMTLLL